MWEALLLSSCCLLQIITSGVVLWAAREYIRARRLVVNIASSLQKYSFLHINRNMRDQQRGQPQGHVEDMQMDDLIDQLLDEERLDSVPRKDGIEAQDEFKANEGGGVTGTTSRHRERLAALVAGGQAKHYGLSVHGKTLTVDQVDSLDQGEVEKLYARYEARLGAAMTKTLGQAALQLYASLASKFLPIPTENQSALLHDLQSDPFVGHALSSATCELYHRYGMFLAPLTATLTTAKYCQFGDQCPREIKDDGDDGKSGDAIGESDSSTVSTGNES